jgi:Ca-activated chloride channel family protein
MRGRLVIIALALVAVGIAFTASRDGDPKKGEPNPRGAQEAALPANALRISFLSSTEKEAVIAPLVERFNAERHRSGGRPVHVDTKFVPSGEVETGIAGGKLQPVMWSPASSFWGRLLNYDTDRALVADENPSIMRTPLVIAMWKQLADAYGYPRRSFGFKSLDTLATGGWAAVGKPQFGAFKYVHTNPDYSTSGLSAVAASYYAAVDKREGLTEADVARGRERVRRLEQSIVHYGDITSFIESEMHKHGLGYASAAAMEETTLIHFNRNAGDGARLVAVYPEEGTFVSDNPLITLQGDWVSPEEKRAAAVFAKYVAGAVTPEVAGAEGFRPARRDTKPAGFVSGAYGVDPDEPQRELSLPEPKVLAKIRSAWHADRKAANVMLVFDNSASMGDEDKLGQAKEGLKEFFRQVAPQDRVGLLKFSDRITQLVPIAPVRTNRAKLVAATQDIVPEDETRVRDATLVGVQKVEAKLDPHAINAVVVLTDGMDNKSTHSGYDVIQQLEEQGRKESGGQVRVFTIAYGRDANAEELAKYSEASGGRTYKGGTGQIADVYRQISSFF